MFLVRSQTHLFLEVFTASRKIFEVALHHHGSLDSCLDYRRSTTTLARSGTRLHRLMSATGLKLRQVGVFDEASDGAVLRSLGRAICKELLDGWMEERKG